MLEGSGIYIKYLQQSQLSSALSALEQQKMLPLLLLDHFPQTTALFGSQKSIATQPLIHLRSGLDSIGEKQCELWVGNDHWQQGSINLQENADLSFCFSQDSLIGSLSISLLPEHSLLSLSQAYYEQIIDFIQTQNKPHLLRMWNYFPDINQTDNFSGDSLERYQQFCIGRHNAFASGATKEFAYPAASAVGSCSKNASATHGAKMVIVFIAMNKAAQFLENPEQISAYQYPNHYSPKSPSFARASFCQTEKLQQLYISGTASIVGHESKFHDNIIKQTQQTIKNLQRLIQHSNEECAADKLFSMASGRTISGAPAIKVYLRKPTDFTKVLPIIQEFTLNCKNICYLQADICRRELDIEIEMLLNKPIS